MIFILDEKLQFPDVEHADENGLLAVGGDLSPQRLLLAYRSGIFPWMDEPLLWFSPDPRMIIDIHSFKPAKSLQRTMAKGHFSFTFDTCFKEVIQACADMRPDTWISDHFVQGYTNLHEMGYAHSVETWVDGKLAGGLYGVSIGSAFFGESMFFRVRDASKAAFCALIDKLKVWDFILLDAQVNNPHLETLGGIDIPREAYLLNLQKALLKETRLGPWEIDN